ARCPARSGQQRSGENDEPQREIRRGERERGQVADLPRQKESALRGRGMDHSEERQDGGDPEIERASPEALVDQLGRRGAPEERGHDESVSEQAYRAKSVGEVSGQVGQRRARRGNERSHLEGHEEGDRWQERERERGRNASRGREGSRREGGKTHVEQ